MRQGTNVAIDQPIDRTISIEVKDIRLNENNPIARALVLAAHEFLLSYLQCDDDLSERRHMLAAGAADVVFSASFVNSYYKHDVLGAVHKKLEAAKAKAEIAA